MARSQRKPTWDDFSWSDDTPDFSEYLVEPPLARRRRLKLKDKEARRALEVDRSGSVVNLERAAKRLRSAHAAARVLRVPHWDMEKAVEAMKLAGVSGSVSNLCGSQHMRVKPKADKPR